MKLTTAALISLISVSVYAGETIECVAVQVNDEILSRSELLARKKTVLDDLYRMRLSEAELQKQLSGARERLVPALVEEMLLLQKAKDSGLQVATEELDRIIRSIMEQNQMPDEAALKRTLEAEGMSLTELKKNVQRRSLIEKLKQFEIAAKVVVTEEEAARYYESHLDDFKDAERVRLREIVLLTEGRIEDQVQKETEELAKLIRNGADFAELATLFSHAPTAEHGGDLGLRITTELAPEIREVAEKLEPGQVSDPLRTKFGFHILKLVEKKPVTHRSLEDSRSDITARIQDQQFEDKIKSYVEELKKQAYIKINDNCFEGAL